MCVHRIHACFQARSATARLTDNRLLIPLLVIVGFEVILLATFTALERPIPYLKEHSHSVIGQENKFVFETQITYLVPGWTAGPAFVTLIGYNMTLILLCCIMSFKVYRVPSEYQVYLFLFFIVIVFCCVYA